MAVTRDNEITPYSINYSYSIPIPPHLQSYQNNNQNQNHYELNQNHQNHHYEPNQNHHYEPNQNHHYEPNQNHHYEPNQNHQYEPNQNHQYEPRYEPNNYDQRYQTRYSFELKSPSNYLNPTTPQTINFNQHNNNNNNNNFSPPFPTQFPTYSESNQTYLKSEPLISNELQSQLTPLPHHPTTTTTNHQYHPNQNQNTTFSEITGSILKTDHNLIVSNPSLPNLNNINMTFWDPQGNWAPNLYQNNLSNLMSINSPFQDIHPITSPITTTTTTTTNSQPFPSSHQLTPTLSIKKLDSNSSLRFQATLDAPTANNINIGDQPITYLNKSQYYTISLQDEQQSDCTIKTTIVLQFFKPDDRKEAHKNWERWLKLQSNSQSAQAVTIDPTNATGILSNPVTTYDRTTITWNGRHGAQFPIKINCLSTDFIEVKGVSGKPLRLVLHSNPTNSSEYSTNQQPEYSSAQLKIYRDKGAERKNMEGQNHPTKKFKSNHREELNATLSLYAPSYPTTTFYPLELDSYDEILDSFTPVTGPKPNHLPFTTTKIRDRKFNTLSGAEFPDLVDIDPSYIPHLRPPPPTSRCLLIKFPTDPLYRAIYLHTATVPELIAQVATKFQFQKGAIRSCTHRPSSSSSTSTPPTPLTDATVAQFPEEMTLTVEVDHTDQAMALVFTY